MAGRFKQNATPISGDPTNTVGEIRAQTFDKPFLQAVGEGLVPGYSVTNKFGFHEAVGSTLIPISTAGVYQTPTTAQSIEIVSDDANDTAAGSGAQTVTVVGLDANWDEQTVTATMDGTTPAAITGTWLRVYRAYVETSGTYASQVAGSHAGTLTIQNSGAGVVWGVIGIADSGFPIGQTEIAVMTIPAGFTGYVLSKHITVESNKVPNILWFRRENADDVTTPFAPMRLFERHNGAAGEITYSPPASPIIVPEKTDIGAMGYIATGSADISVEFQILLKAN